MLAGWRVVGDDVRSPFRKRERRASTPYVAAYLMLAAMALHGQDEAPEEASAPPVRIMFAPPDLPGRFVLGIFDSENRLVRTLARDREATEFDVGLNGYITYWDGKNDAGDPCASGTYSARGFVVGEAIEAGGEAFHFNDWIDGDADAPVTEVLSIGLAGDDAVVALLRTEDGAVIEKIGFAGGPVETVSVEPGRLPELEKAANLAVAVGMAAGGESDGRVPPMPEEGKVRSFSGGKAGSIWAVVASGGETGVVQFSPEGEVLRQLRPDGGFVPVMVRASTSTELVAVLESDGVSQRVRCLRLTAEREPEEPDGGTAVSDWEVVFERTLTPCADFGIRDGRLVPDGTGVSLPRSIEVGVVENTLDPDRRRIEVEAGFDAEGSFLQSADGLRLVPVSNRAGIRRIAIVPGAEPGSAVVFQGNGAVVEEFSVPHLDRIAAFDCGSFQLANE